MGEIVRYNPPYTPSRVARSVPFSFPPGGRVVRSLIRLLSVFALAFLVAGTVRAEDKKPVEKKPVDKKDEVKKPATPFAGMFAFPKTVTLSEDQQKKLDELKKEYTPKLEELK